MNGASNPILPNAPVRVGELPPLEEAHIATRWGLKAPQYIQLTTQPSGKRRVYWCPYGSARITQSEAADTLCGTGTAVRLPSWMGRNHLVSIANQPHDKAEGQFTPTSRFILQQQNDLEKIFETLSNEDKNLASYLQSVREGFFQRRKNIVEPVSKSICSKEEEMLDELKDHPEVIASRSRATHLLPKLVPNYHEIIDEAAQQYQFTYLEDFSHFVTDLRNLHVAINPDSSSNSKALDIIKARFPILSSQTEPDIAHKVFQLLDPTLTSGQVYPGIQFLRNTLSVPSSPSMAKVSQIDDASKSEVERMKFEEQEAEDEMEKEFSREIITDDERSDNEEMDQDKPYPEGSKEAMMATAKIWERVLDLSTCAVKHEADILPFFQRPFWKNTLSGGLTKRQTNFITKSLEYSAGSMRRGIKL